MANGQRVPHSRHSPQEAVQVLHSVPQLKTLYYQISLFALCSLVYALINAILMGQSGGVGRMLWGLMPFAPLAILLFYSARSQIRPNIAASVIIRYDGFEVQRQGQVSAIPFAEVKKIELSPFFLFNSSFKITLWDHRIFKFNLQFERSGDLMDAILEARPQLYSLNRLEYLRRLSVPFKHSLERYLVICENWKTVGKIFLGVPAVLAVLPTVLQAIFGSYSADTVFEAMKARFVIYGIMNIFAVAGLYLLMEILFLAKSRLDISRNAFAVERNPVFEKKSFYIVNFFYAVLCIGFFISLCWSLFIK